MSLQTAPSPSHEDTDPDSRLGKEAGGEGVQASTASEAGCRQFTQRRRSCRADGEPSREAGGRGCGESRSDAGVWGPPVLLHLRVTCTPTVTLGGPPPSEAFPVSPLARTGGRRG